MTKWTNNPNWGDEDKDDWDEDDRESGWNSDDSDWDDEENDEDDPKENLLDEDSYYGRDEEYAEEEVEVD